MFSKATANFVRHIDPEGSLIHVSRLNDSQKLVPMALVIKRNRMWFWQRPKYLPTDLTLSSLLQGGDTLIPEVSETDFASYEEKSGDKLSGEVGTEAGSVKVKLKGNESSNLKSCFGQLKKEELVVIKLLCNTRDRQVNMQHVLMQQIEKRAEVLAVVKERIITTTLCSINQTKKEQCTFQGVLGLLGMLGSSFQVCVKDHNKLQADSDVSLEIPSGTVVAYSVLELEIKKNGHFDICLSPGKIGGIEEDSPVTSPSHIPMDTLDGNCNGQQAPHMLPSKSNEMDLSSLADLPQSTRCALFKSLQETLSDRGALSYLQCMLEDLCSGENPDVSNLEELSESQRETWSAVQDSFTENSQGAHLNAAHLLVSALEELPDETLRLLRETCPDFLEAFNTLVCRLKDSSKPLHTQHLPSLLQDNLAFQQAERLLSSTSVTLRRDTDRLWLETGSQAGVLPVLLRLSVQGLSLLCKGVK